MLLKKSRFSFLKKHLAFELKIMTKHFLANSRNILYQWLWKILPSIYAFSASMSKLSRYTRTFEDDLNQSENLSKLERVVHNENFRNNAIFNLATISHSCPRFISSHTASFPVLLCIANEKKNVHFLSEVVWNHINFLDRENDELLALFHAKLIAWI